MAILKILKKKKKKNPLGGLKIKILHIRMVCTWENGKIKKEKLLIRLMLDSGLNKNNQPIIEKCN